MYSRAAFGFSARRRYQSRSLGVGFSFIVAPFHEVDHGLESGADVHEHHADSVQHLENLVELALLGAAAA